MNAIIREACYRIDKDREKNNNQRFYTDSNIMIEIRKMTNSEIIRLCNYGKD